MDTQFYSLEEVAKHDGKPGNRTWIVVKDNVYDVTEYLDEHPGGGELITEWGGKESTKAYDDAGHSSDANKDLKRFKIGELRQEDRKQKKQKKTETDVKNTQEKENMRSCCSYVTCGLCG